MSSRYGRLSLTLVLSLFALSSAALADERLRIKAHFSGATGAWIYALEFTPDDTLLVSSDDRTIKLWNVATGKLRLRIPRKYKSSVQPVAISADNQTLAVIGATPYTIELLSVERGRRTGELEVWPFPGKKPVTPRPVLPTFRTSIFRALAFSPDGATLAVGSPALTLVDVKSGKVRTLENYLKPNQANFLECHVHYLRFSSDGKALLCANSKGVIRLWDLEQLKPVREFLVEKPSHVAAVVFSDQGNRLAVVDGDTVVVWNTANGEKVQTLQPDTRPTCLALSRDGQSLASGRGDGSVDLWDLTKAVRRRVLRSGGTTVSPPLRLAFSHDGKSVASAGVGTIRVWELAEVGSVRRRD